MQKFKRLPEPETVLRVLTLEEERRLVEAVMLHDAVIGGRTVGFSAKQVCE
jgi:hypothetical protein